MKIYESLDDIPLYSWNKFMETDDNNWFLIDYNGKQEKIIDKNLEKIAIELKDLYFQLAGGDMFVSKLQKGAKRDYLILKYDTVKQLLELLMNENVINNAEMRLFCIQQLKKFGFSIPEINDYEGDIEAINGAINSLDGIITQINIINDDLKREGVKINLNKELILVSMGLELGYRLDAKAISVSEWLEYVNLLKDKNENLKDK
jgi:hypothetical protein